MKLTELAIRRPAFMTMIFSALAVIGIFSYFSLGSDFLPKMEWPYVGVSIVYPGAGPKEIETQISKPVEGALSSINGIKTLRTYSSEGNSFAIVQFQMSVDVNQALSDVDRKMNEIKADLPKDILQPQIFKFNINSLPILRISTVSQLDEQKFYQLVKDYIKPRLEQVDGVSQVTIVGGKEREIRVEIDNDKLKSYNLSVSQVTQIIGAENLDFPTGQIQQFDKKYTVRVAGKFKDIEQIKNTRIAATDKGIIKVSDIANVIDTYKEKYSYSRLNGQTGMGLQVQKASDANSIKTADKVMKVLKELEEEYASNGISFTISQDQTEFTREALGEVMRDLGIAILMVAVVLFFFLHDIKNAAIVLLSIPTSLVSTFIFMNIMGFTLNLITLLALTLVIGILVDDSIVVLENIHRHLDRGENPREAAIKGRGEIGMAAIAITLVDVVVFLPVAMVGGIVGKIFREFGLTVVIATLFSLFVSFTLTPLLASRMSKMVHYAKTSLLGKFFAYFDKQEASLADAYRKLLNWGLNHKFLVVAASFILLFFSLALVPSGMVGTEFMPNTDKGEFAVKLELPLGTNIEKTNQVVTDFEKTIKAMPEVERYYTNIGRVEEGGGVMEKPNAGQIQIKLVPTKQRSRSTQEIINEVAARAEKIPGVKSEASLIGIMGTADEAAIFIEVKGPDLDSIIKYSSQVLAIVKGTKGARDGKSSWEEGQPEVQVQIDRDKCAAYGLTLGEVATNLRNAFEGDITSKFKEGDTEYDMRILLSKKNRDNPEDVAATALINRDGKLIKLSDVANIYFGKGPAQIQRKDKSRSISVTANLDNTRPFSEVMGEIQEGIAQIKMPPSVKVQYAGAQEDMETMFADMMLAIMFAVLFVYMIMVSLYESFINPFIIMFSLPVALFGALGALFLSGLNLNTFSMIGILMAIGLVTKNAILLVDYTNTLRRKGLTLREALVEAGPIRLRPIVMTTSTMIIGMLPLALGASGAGDMRQGLAWVVIGALLSSTMLTLVLVPVVYMIVDKVAHKLGLAERYEKKLMDMSVQTDAV